MNCPAPLIDPAKKGNQHENNYFDVYQPDATLAGGIAPVKKVLDQCRETGRPFLYAEFHLHLAK